MTLHVEGQQAIPWDIFHQGFCSMISLKSILFCCTNCGVASEQQNKELFPASTSCPSTRKTSNWVHGTKRLISYIVETFAHGDENKWERWGKKPMRKDSTCN